MSCCSAMTGGVDGLRQTVPPNLALVAGGWSRSRSDVIDALGFTHHGAAGLRTTRSRSGDHEAPGAGCVSRRLSTGRCACPRTRARRRVLAGNSRGNRGPRAFHRSLSIRFTARAPESARAGNKCRSRPGARTTVTGPRAARHSFGRGAGQSRGGDLEGELRGTRRTTRDDQRDQLTANHARPVAVQHWPADAGSTSFRPSSLSESCRRDG
jgi:hypothetical protein